jgi:branched-chain amino acid transport system substrate-binding protein
MLVKRNLKGGNHMHKRAAVLRGAISVLAVTSAITVSSMQLAGAASKTSAPIKVGLVTSLTGPAAVDLNGAKQGVEAAFDAQNAKGGVDGHKLQLVAKSDTTTVTGASTAVSTLIDTSHVFSLIFISATTSGGAYRIAQQAGVPVVGAAVDGPEWGEQPNTNMFSDLGDHAAILPPNSLVPTIAKAKGAKVMAVLANAGEVTSIHRAEAMEVAAKAAGLGVYFNDSLPIGTLNVGPLVLAMKAAGVDSFYAPESFTTVFAIMKTAKEDGLKIVAPILSVGYTQDLLNTKAAEPTVKGALFTVTYRPFTEPNSATKALTSALQKYIHYTGLPGYNWTYGWLSGQLVITGLEKTHGDATRVKFMSALRSLKAWTATGLLAQPDDFSLADFGKTPGNKTCNYVVEFNGTKFVAQDGGKPVCGINEKS